MKKFFPVSAALFLLIWGVHLVTGTLALRGFFGDGSLAFLLNLSKSYVFNHTSHLIYLYSANTPREAQFLLNSIGLQAALALNIHNRLALEYIFNFWQFALPGFLYLGLFFVLARTKNLAWGIFPLMSWAILSAPVDWNAVNSSRWAVPIFWMHILLVMLADKKIRPAPALAVGMIGGLMLGGLYETVLLQAVLTLAIGVALWRREGNRVPLIYASAAVPGAIRAAYSYFGQGGDQLPNGFHQLAIMTWFPAPYILFMLVALAGGLILLFTHPRAQRVAPVPLAILLVATAIYVLSSGLPELWMQVELRFDYLLLSFGLMIVAGFLRIWNHAPRIETALPAAHLILLSGMFLWALQTAGTFAWQDCRTAYKMTKGDAAMIVAQELLPLFQPRAKTQSIQMQKYGQCLWDWAEPWEDLLTAPDGGVTQWEQFTFWQDFRFTKQEGQIYLASNNGTLVPPSADPAAIDLPLKTILYDLTPLYRRVGDGPLLAHATCLDPDLSGSYWHDYLEKLDDKKRQRMFVCLRTPDIIRFNISPAPAP